MLTSISNFKNTTLGQPKRRKKKNTPLSSACFCSKGTRVHGTTQPCPRLPEAAGIPPCSILTGYGEPSYCLPWVTPQGPAEAASRERRGAGVAACCTGSRGSEPCTSPQATGLLPGIRKRLQQTVVLSQRVPPRGTRMPREPVPGPTVLPGRGWPLGAARPRSCPRALGTCMRFGRSRRGHRSWDQQARPPFWQREVLPCGKGHRNSAGSEQGQLQLLGNKQGLF